MASQELVDSEMPNEGSSDASLDHKQDIEQVQAALLARVLRLSDNARPAADALCRTGRKGIMEHVAHPVLGFDSRSDLILVMLHVVDAIKGLYEKCGMNHGRVSIDTIRFQRRKSTVGVLIDHDDRNEENAKESRATLETRRITESSNPEVEKRSIT